MGLSPTFDQNPCQVHIFQLITPEKGPPHLLNRLSYRVKFPNGQYETRVGVGEIKQNFLAQPGILLVKTGKLNQRETWYILDYSHVKGEEFVLVSYNGVNDAWAGFSGAVLYTREKEVPARTRARAEAALTKAGIEPGDMVMTDNTCGAIGVL